MKAIRWHWIGVLLALCAISIPTRGSGQELKHQLESLEEDFRHFRFEMVLKKGRFLLAEPLLQRSDSLRIYQFMLNAAYALGDTVQARQIIEEILKAFPNFQPDPRITSPKIIEFYNYYRKEWLKKHPVSPINETGPPPVHAVVVKPIPLPLLLSSAVFPGSGHWWRGYRKRSYVLMGGSTFLLATAFYFTHLTESYRKDYLQAKTDFDVKYNRYNRAYRIRNGLWLLYGVWSIWNIYDLIRQDWHRATQSRPVSQRLQWQVLPLSRGVRARVFFCF